MSGRKKFNIPRDTILFFAGLYFAYNEVIVREGERPYVLGFIVLLLGLPVALGVDSIRKISGGRGRAEDPATTAKPPENNRPTKTIEFRGLSLV